VKGFCPSFVTVDGGQLRQNTQQAQAAQPLPGTPLPDPVLPSTSGVWGIVVAGVGGTGVITIGQLLGMAAHLEGRGIVTQDAAGLAQKGGATWSHVLLADTQDSIRTTRVSMAAADLILACDPVVAAHPETLLRMRQGRTHVALNTHGSPTAAFVHHADWQDPSAACAAEIVRAVGPQAVASFDADAAARRLMGDSLYANPMLLGYAWQKGWVPLQLDALLRAMELNAMAVEANKTAFAWGRHAAHDPACVAAPAQTIRWTSREPLDAMLVRRVAFLTAYQDAAYADSYLLFVQQVRSTEQPLGKQLPLTEAVARYLFKLMAYKDEYEVARLHSDPAFLARIQSQFEGDYVLRYHLAPPWLSPKNTRGEAQKLQFGPRTQTLFRLLARLKGLRGTAFDPFGYSPERRTERALVQQYRADIAALLPRLTPANHAAVVEFARIPEQIRGFGHVKARHLAAARLQWAAQWAALNAA
jgi:indolepyruvate ferredoxin oxidoreductase